MLSDGLSLDLTLSRSNARKRVRVGVTPSLLHAIPEPESSVLISGPSKELDIRGHSVHFRGETGEWGRRQVTIDVLPDDVLLEIFEIDTASESISRWHTLVHVCRRWRCVVFASTRRLNLRLLCTSKTPARKMLDIWPALPIVIRGDRTSREGADNIFAALEHPDRVCRIMLSITLDGFAAAMNEPFPELTSLILDPSPRVGLYLPDSFLGGSAPRLQTLHFSLVSFPALPKLLSSAGDPVRLDLFDIPYSGYISPEAMVTGLSALTKLERLSIGFQQSIRPSGGPGFNFAILCKTSYGQLSSLTQFCGSPFLSFFNLEHLEICESPYGPGWEGVENIQWLELLHLFPTVKRLSLCKKSTPRVMHALQELSGERMMDVLPALQSISIPEISLSGPVKEAFAQFLTARQLSGHPVAYVPSHYSSLSFDSVAHRLQYYFLYIQLRHVRMMWQTSLGLEPSAVGGIVGHHAAE
ncbi:hypothetical protein BC826DRAFT_970275 [Russula brevipes]|nr:hypothetical protein BC826DRAFT_970275 [Russula brevipes]